MYEIHRNDVAVTTGITDQADARFWLGWHLDHAGGDREDAARTYYLEGMKGMIARASVASVYTLDGDDFRIVTVGDTFSAPAYGVGLYQRERSWYDDREVGQSLINILPARTLREAAAIRRRLEACIDDEHHAVHELRMTPSGIWSQRFCDIDDEDPPF